MVSKVRKRTVRCVLSWVSVAIFGVVVLTWPFVEMPPVVLIGAWLMTLALYQIALFGFKE